MILWLDAHISPGVAPWLRMRFDLEAIPVRALGFREAEDADIFAAAKRAGAVVMTKDSDFVELLERHGPPPQVIWLRSGNTSNARLRHLFTHALPPVLEMLRARCCRPLDSKSGSAGVTTCFARPVWQKRSTCRGRAAKRRCTRCGRYGR